MLTDDEKERVRYHLGYPQVQPAAAMTFGLPTPVQTLFLVDSAMNRLIQHAEDRVRKILTILDGIEDKLVDAQDRLAAERLEELTLREDEPNRLEAEYLRWAQRLANMLGVPPYPYSDRFARSARGATVPVRNG